VIALKNLTAKLDAFFNISAFDESKLLPPRPAGYDSMLARFAVPEFSTLWNGLMLNNAPEIDRVYLVVFPNQEALDQIIAREVERGAPGGLIFSHHPADFSESLPEPVYITETLLEDLREHRINLYHCHAPLDCHPEISTSGAIAEALKMKVLGRCAPYRGGMAGVYGKIPYNTFDECARKVAESMDLPTLRYVNIRHDGLPVHKAMVVAGGGGATLEYIQEAIDLGCDTYITGEWSYFGPGEWRAAQREALRAFLAKAQINLIAGSHYASEMVVMRDQMRNWFKEQVPGIEVVLIGQKDPWR